MIKKGYIMKTSEIEPNELQRFIEYVELFYNEKDGIFPIIGLTSEMILDATQKYINSLTEEYTWGGGDSIDRERVRDIILFN